MMKLFNKINSKLKDWFEETKCTSCKGFVPTFPNTYLRAGKLYFCSEACLVQFITRNIVGK